MADPTEQRVKAERLAEELRANLKRRKTQTRNRSEPQELGTDVAAAHHTGPLQNQRANDQN